MLNINVLKRSSTEIFLKNKNIRFLSKLQPANEKANKDVAVKKPDIKHELEELSKDSRDNFLIGFRDKKPTYDQLFEYKNPQPPVIQVRKPLFKDILSTENMIKLHKKYDMSLDGLTQWYKAKLDKIVIDNQAYNVRRHGILGPDLATAHFVTARGGKVRFKHMPDKWILNDRELPDAFDKTYRLISVDASKLYFYHEALENFILLNELEELNLSNNKLDNFGCDKLARIFRNSTSLTYLDLSGNNDITNHGVEALYKIPSLKYLIIKNTKASKYAFIELLILMFNDIRPDCKIIYK